MHATSASRGWPPDAPFAFSQSSLQDYLDCPRRFQLRYILDMPWPAVEAEPLSQLEHHQGEAMLFHRLVQQYLLGVPAAALAGMADSIDLARWWQNFLAAAPDLEGWQLYTEKALTCHVGSHRLVCKYDLLAIRDGRALIFDWKTSARRPRTEWLGARMQTKVYRALLVRSGAELNGGRPFAPADISMAYWFAEFPEDPAKLAFDGQQFDRDWQSLGDLIAEITSTIAFPLTDDARHCRFCTYRSLCDRGQLAGTDPEYESPSSGAEASTQEDEQIGEFQG